MGTSCSSHTFVTFAMQALPKHPRAPSRRRHRRPGHVNPVLLARARARASVTPLESVRSAAGFAGLALEGWTGSQWFPAAAQASVHGAMHFGRATALWWAAPCLAAPLQRVLPPRLQPRPWPGGPVQYWQEEEDDGACTDGRRPRTGTAVTVSGLDVDADTDFASDADMSDATDSYLAEVPPHVLVLVVAGRTAVCRTSRRAGYEAVDLEADAGQLVFVPWPWVIRAAPGYRAVGLVAAVPHAFV
jgi:hypothetical protein